jgi:hypothetical protein
MYSANLEHLSFSGASAIKSTKQSLMSFVGKNASPKKCVSHFPISDDLSEKNDVQCFSLPDFVGPL